MMLTMWILLAVFGPLALVFVLKLFISKVNWMELIFMVFSVLVSAVSVGIIHAGSLQAFLGS